MPGPKLPAVEVTVEERAELERVVRRRTAGQQLVERARIVLLASDGLSNSEVARTMDVHIDTVRKWRRRWCGTRGVPLAELSVTARLGDAPRPGTPARITPEQVCRIMALACEAPGESGRPISQWSTTELAAEIMRRGIVETISPRHAARLLKRGISGRT
jgi:putative transposase